MALSAAAVAYTATGGLVLYSGVKGATLASTARAVLSGNLTLTDTEEINFGSGSSGGGGGSGGGSGAVASGDAAKAQAYAKSRMPAYGWSDTDYSDLVQLWQRESGWSNTADTRRSGLDPANAATFAYGIAQARPATKYPKPGQPPDLGGKADAQTQIDWGLGYIRDTYGSPAMAWGHEEQNGWY